MGAHTITMAVYIHPLSHKSHRMAKDTCSFTGSRRLREASPPTRLRFWMDKRLPAATLPHAISALAASYTSIRRKCISNSSADLPRFAVRGRVFRLDFRVNFGNDFACNSLLFLLHHGRSYIYDLLIIFFPYRAARPCSRPPVAAGAGPNRPNPSTGVPLSGGSSGH